MAFLNPATVPHTEVILREAQNRDMYSRFILIPISHGTDIEHDWRSGPPPCHTISRNRKGQSLHESIINVVVHYKPIIKEVHSVDCHHGSIRVEQYFSGSRAGTIKISWGRDQRGTGILYEGCIPEPVDPISGACRSHHAQYGRHSGINCSKCTIPIPYFIGCSDSETISVIEHPRMTRVQLLGSEPFFKLLLRKRTP